MDNDSQSASGYASHADTGNKGGGSGGKKHDATCDTVQSKHITDDSAKQYDRNTVKQDDDMTSDTVDSKDDKNAVKQDNDMISDTVDSKDKSDSSARQDDRNVVKQHDEHESDYGPDSVKRQILQGE